MDGRIIIGIDINDKDFDKKMANLEKRIKANDNEIEINMSAQNIDDVEKELQKVSKEIDRLQEKGEGVFPFKMPNDQVIKWQSNLTEEEEEYFGRLQDAFAELQGKFQRMKFGEVDMSFVEKVKNSYKDLEGSEERQLNNVNAKGIKIAYMKQDLRDMIATYNSMKKQSIIDSSEQKRIEQLKKDIIELQREIEKTSGKKIKINVEGFNDAKDSTSGIDNLLSEIPGKISGIVLGVGKWALALFGIRTAYNFIRNSMSTLTQYDDQLKVDMDYIKYSLAMTVKPIVEVIVRMAYDLLNVINGISKALFSYDLFSGATKDNFRKTSGYAQDIKKSLAGFDEMNILGDNTTSAGGGAPEPSYNWGGKAEEEGIKLGDKLKKIFQETIDFWMNDGIQQLYAVEGPWSTFFMGLGDTLQGFFDVFKGIWDTICGLVDMLVGIFTGDEEKIQEGWDKFTKGLGEIVKGLFEIICGLIEMIVGLVVGVIAELFSAIGKFIKWVIDGVKGIIETIINLILAFIILIINNIWNTITTIINFIASIPGAIANFISSILNSIGTFLGNLKKKFKEKFDDIKEFMMAPINNFIDGIKNLWKNIKSSVEEVGRKIGEKLNPGKIVDDVKNGLGSIGNGIKNFFGFSKGGVIYPPKLAVGGVINQPGRGVPLTSAIGGEHGAEGVIPLTDSQQMQLLGEAIGKYITINASITNTMNGRVISRELQRVQNESDFAFNR